MDWPKTSAFDSLMDEWRVEGLTLFALPNAGQDDLPPADPETSTMAAKKRALKGLFATALGAIGFGGMSAAGFTPGTDFDGIDGSTIRDTVTGAVTVASIFLPQLAPVANIVKSLSNHRAVEQVTAETDTQNSELAKLERRVARGYRCHPFVGTRGYRCHPFVGTAKHAKQKSTLESRQTRFHGSER